MLDLTKCQQRFYEIKWFDGEILKLKLPTREMLVTILDFTSIKSDGENDQDPMKELCKLLLKIFNRNDNGRTFHLKEFDEMWDLDTMMLVLTDYMNASFERMGESLSPTCPVRK